MKKIILLIFSLCVITMSQATSVWCNGGGQLSNVLQQAGIKCKNITSLIFTTSTSPFNGMLEYSVLSATDFYLIRDSMPNLTYLDLTNVQTNIQSTTSPDSIPANAFQGCTNLVQIVLPSPNICSIGNQAFYGCTGLRAIYTNEGYPPTLGTDVFDGVNYNLCTIYASTLPYTEVALYKADPQWGLFTHIIATTSLPTPPITAGVQQIEDNVLISPNPVVDNFNISGLTNTETLQLFNLNGKLIFSKQVNNGNVSASFLKTGVYILKIGSFETKLIKE